MWEPHDLLLKPGGNAELVAIADRFYSARKKQSRLTFDDFCKRKPEKQRLTADEDGLCVFNSMKITLELAGIAHHRFDQVFDEFKPKEVRGHQLTNGSDRTALEAFVKLLVKRKIHIALKNFKNAMIASINGVDKLTELPLSDGVYVAGIYDYLKPTVGHCAGLKVEDSVFFVAERVKKGKSLKFLHLGGRGEFGAYGAWINEIRFMFLAIPFTT